MLARFHAFKAFSALLDDAGTDFRLHEAMDALAAAEVLGHTPAIETAHQMRYENGRTDPIVIVICSACFDRLLLGPAYRTATGRIRVSPMLAGRCQG